jgi:hypothetical protein
MIIILGIAILAAVIYFLIKRTPTPKSIGGKSADSPTYLAYSPFGEPGKFSFETREFNGINYVWKDGKWEKTSK